jgi:hypothetical protein
MTKYAWRHSIERSGTSPPLEDRRFAEPLLTEADGREDPPRRSIVVAPFGTVSNAVVFAS